MMQTDIKPDENLSLKVEESGNTISSNTSPQEPLTQDGPNEITPDKRNSRRQSFDVNAQNANSKSPRTLKQPDDTDKTRLKASGNESFDEKKTAPRNQVKFAIMEDEKGSKGRQEGQLSPNFPTGKRNDSSDDSSGNSSSDSETDI